MLTGTTLLDETITYDAAGNRREVSATSGATTVNAWYTYDGDNRVAVSAGSLVNGQIVVTDTANAYAQTYDGDGNVTSQLTVNGAGDTLVQRSTYNARDQLVRADYAVDLTTGGASRGVEETRTYDADGHVLIDDQYYALGTMLGALPAHRVNPDDPDSGDSGDTGSTGTDVGGELDSATIDYYDSVGRLAVAQTFGHASGWDGSDGGAAPTSAPGVDATTFGALSLQSEVVYQGAGGSAGYDADGDVVAYQYRDGSGRIDQYAVTYLRKDSYLQSTTSGENVSNTPNVRPSTDESVYDDRGNLVALTQHTQYAGGTVADTVRVFAYDGNGEIIERRDGTANGATLDQGTSSAHENQHYVYVNGQQVAHVDEGGTVDVLSEVTAFSSSTNGPNDYVVQAGDTLQSIAQAAYGDASLWYVIAQANALSSDSDLSIGQRLTIPQVTTNSNTATTVKPYDPSQVIGSTTPNLPIIAPPPPPPSHHCNALADIVVIAVTIAVTIATQGATTGLLVDELGTVGSAVLSGAIAGAAGNVAGQLTGDALGVHSGFSLDAVFDSAIASGLTAGLTSGIGQSGVGALTDSSASNGLSALGDAVQGAGSYVANDLAAKVTGQPAHFSWAGLVATSLGNAISGELGPSRVDTQLGLTPGSYLEQVGARAAGDVVDREASVVLGDNHVQSFAQVGEDIAGYAIGNPIGQALGNRAVMAIQNYKNQQALNALNTSVNQSLNNQINGLNVSLGAASANTSGQNIASNGSNPYGLGTLYPGAYGPLQTGNSGGLASSPPGGFSSDLPLPDGVLPINNGIGPVTYESSPSANGETGTYPLIGTSEDGETLQFFGAPAVTGRITGFNGAPGFQYSDGTQTFAASEDSAVGSVNLLNPVANAPAPSTALETLEAFGNGVLNGLSGATDHIGEFIGGQLYIGIHEGIGATVVGKAVTNAAEFAVNEGQIAVTQGFDHTQTGQALNQLNGFTNYLVNDRSISEDLNGASDFSSQQISNVATYYNTHTGAQIGYDVGNEVGGQIPALVLTAGAGTAVDAAGQALDLTATAVTRAFGAVADTLGDVNFVGSSGRYGSFAVDQLGAVGEDLSGFRPGINAATSIPESLDVVAPEVAIQESVGFNAGLAPQEDILGSEESAAGRTLQSEASIARLGEGGIDSVGSPNGFGETLSAQGLSDTEELTPLDVPNTAEVSTAARIDSGLTVNVNYTPLAGSEAEFLRQLAGQEVGLNNLTAGEIQSNIEAFNLSGRPSSASDAVALFRTENPITEDPFVEGYLNSVSGDSSRFAALHEPDMVIGGRADGVAGYGDFNVNSSLGAQNRYRQNLIYDAVKSVPPNSYVNFVFGVTGK